MKYFYCQSYQAFNFALNIHQSEDIAVITSSESIIKAADFIGINCIRHKKFSISDFITKRVSVIKERNRINQVIQGGEFHFSHSQYALFCFVIVSQLIKNKQAVYFHDFEYVYLKATKKTLSVDFLFYSFLSFYLNKLYHIPVELRNPVPSKYVISLKNSYIYNCGIIIRNDRDSYFIQIMRTIKSLKLFKHDIKVLFVGQSLDNRFFDNKKIEEINELLNISIVHFKKHPNSQGETFDKCIKVPSFLPVELIFSSVRNFVITYYSYSIVTACSFPGIKAICLLDLISKDDSFKGIKEDLLAKSNDKIIFLKTIEELKILLNEYI